MADVVWIALVSAGGAIVAAAMTQHFSARAASKQADRAEKLEWLQWSRSLEKRRQELHDARLKELWAYVMTSRTQMMDLMAGINDDGAAKVAKRYIPSDMAPATAAGQAYAVALSV